MTLFSGIRMRWRIFFFLTGGLKILGPALKFSLDTKEKLLVVERRRRRGWPGVGGR